MSSKVVPKHPAKRPVRTRAPEPAPPAPVKVEEPLPQPTEPVLAAVVEPVAPVVEPAVAAPAAEAPADAVTKPTGIIAARVHKFLATNGMNAPVSAQLAELKPRVKAFSDASAALSSGKIKVASAEDAKKKVERDITAEERERFTKLVQESAAQHQSDVELVSHLSGCKFRFSAEVDEALAAVCDWMVRDLALHAKNAAKSSNRPRADVDCLYSEGLESRDSFGLISGTQLYRKTHAELRSKRAENAHSAALNAALASQEKDLRKKWRDAGFLKSMPRKKAEVAPEAAQPADPAAPAAPAAAPAPAVAPEEVDQPAKAFHHYVSLLIDSAGDKADFPKNLRKANELIVHLSELVRQFIDRVVTQLGLIMSLTEAKTITLSHIECVVKGFLVDGLSPARNVIRNDEMVPDKTALAAELAKRTAELAAGRKYTINYEALPKVAGFSYKMTTHFASAGFDTVSIVCAEHRKSAHPKQ